MTVKELANVCNLNTVVMPCPDKEIDGVYVGDLLSWVMGRAEAGCVWITIMSNVNVMAVASLTDVSCVLLAEGVTLDGEVLAVAEAKGINVLSSDSPIYETALKIGGILS